MSSQTLTGKAGGRKAAGFYAALGCSFVLALSGKASGEILGLIDTLYLVFAGANVAAKRITPKDEKKEEVT
ncbi:hypothetical protein [uncultured Idiomarina sp.]|uniref:hypothetical protein n=1 Tax=uncultured Idiomarina sp. TaxID=352961 RepID=UPI0032B1F70B|tara:strand:- start:938 stop:1150 length:213 start_codon:yes stop_codon:yes gene_type:complete